MHILWAHSNLLLRARAPLYIRNGLSGNRLFTTLPLLVEHFIHARPPSAFFLRPIATMYVLSQFKGSGVKFYHQKLRVFLCIGMLPCGLGVRWESGLRRRSDFILSSLFHEFQRRRWKSLPNCGAKTTLLCRQIPMVQIADLLYFTGAEKTSTTSRKARFSNW